MSVSTLATGAEKSQFVNVRDNFHSIQQTIYVIQLLSIQESPALSLKLHYTARSL